MARYAATSAIPTAILSRSDRARTSPTADPQPGKSILMVPGELSLTRQLSGRKHFLVWYRQTEFSVSCTACPRLTEPCLQSPPCRAQRARKVKTSGVLRLDLGHVLSRL